MTSKLSKNFRRAVVAGVMLTGAAGTGLAAVMPDNEDLSVTIDTAETSYSKDLDALENRFTERLKNIAPASGRQVVIIDPNKFESAVALGLSPVAAIDRILEGHRTKTSPEVAAEIAKDMWNRPAYSPVTGSARKTDPRTRYLGAENACVITPADPSGSFGIDGLATLETEKFVNYHEGWHCLSFKYNDTKDSDIETLARLDMDKLKAGNLLELAHSPSALRIATMRNKGESFADLGATGDMIREGFPVDIIDRIAEWRRRSSGSVDFEHFSNPSLMALKKRIGDMGVEKFRLLQEAELEKLYYDITDKHALSPEKMKHYLIYNQATPAERRAMNEQMISNPAIRGGIDFDKDFTTPQNPANAPPLMAPEEEQRMKDALNSWDAEKALQDETLRVHGKMTPQTLVKAHASLQTGLRESLKQDPHNLLYPEMMTKLKDSFTGLGMKIAAQQKTSDTPKM